MNLPSPKTLRDSNSRSTSYQLDHALFSCASPADEPGYDNGAPGKKTPRSEWIPTLRDMGDAGGGTRISERGLRGSNDEEGNYDRNTMDVETGRGDGQDAPPSRWGSIVASAKRHAAFIGPGIVASVGYTDPGEMGECRNSRLTIVIPLTPRPLLQRKLGHGSIGRLAVWLCSALRRSSLGPRWHSLADSRRPHGRRDGA